MAVIPMQGPSVDMDAMIPVELGLHLRFHDVMEGKPEEPEEEDLDTPSMLQLTPIEIQLNDWANHDVEILPPREECTPQSIDCSDAFHLASLLDAHCIIPSFMEEPDFEWHPASRPWLSLPWRGAGFGTALHFYTDGSFRDGHGGISVVYFGQVDDEWWYGGYYTQHLPCCAHAHEAELSAIIIALKWAMDELRRHRHFIGTCPEVFLWYDCTSAGLKATGLFGFHASGPQSKSSRSLFQTIQTGFNCTPVGQHVFGHQGNPGNEAANTLANYALQRPWLSGDGLLRPLAAGRFAGTLEWMWLIWRQDCAGCWKDQKFEIHPEPFCQRSDLISQISDQLTSQKETQGTSETFERNMCLKLTTANVLTLKYSKKKEKELGCNSTARQEAIFRQLAESGAHIVALQETRLRKPINNSNPYYHFVSNPATPQGHFGMCVGFSKTLSFLEMDEIGQGIIKENQVKVILQNPRLQILKSAILGFIVFCCMYTDLTHRPLIVRRNPTGKTLTMLFLQNYDSSLVCCLETRMAIWESTRAQQ